MQLNIRLEFTLNPIKAMQIRKKHNTTLKVLAKKGWKI